MALAVWKHRWVRRLSFAALVLVVGYVGMFSLMCNSAAYRQACKFTAENRTVVQALGGPLQVRLAYQVPARISYGSTPTAWFHLLVDGSKAKGVVDIELREYVSEWVVARAQLTLSSGQRTNLK
jgi:hypothetical protein